LSFNMYAIEWNTRFHVTKLHEVRPNITYRS